MGARHVLALINRRAYAELVQADRIDIALSPAQISIGSLLAHVRHGDVAGVHSLRRGAAEALELVAHGDRSNSKVVGRRVEQIDVPRGVTIGAILRAKAPAAAGRGSPSPARADWQVIIAHHDTRIESDDHVIVFVVDKKLVPKVERLFQVGLGFF
jgi:trk system potassium uptake protein TrkA